MKNLLFALVFIPALAFSQEKGDNEIILNGVTYTQVIKALADQGFFFQNKDSESQTAITIPVKPPKRYTWHNGIELAVYIHVKDSTAYITGNYDAKALGLTKVPAQWKGMDRSMNKDAFAWLAEIARAIKPEIIFSKS